MIRIAVEAAFTFGSRNAATTAPLRRNIHRDFRPVVVLAPGFELRANLHEGVGVDFDIEIEIPGPGPSWSERWAITWRMPVRLMRAVSPAEISGVGVFFAGRARGWTDTADLHLFHDAAPGPCLGCSLGQSFFSNRDLARQRRGFDARFTGSSSTLGEVLVFFAFCRTLSSSGRRFQFLALAGFSFSLFFFGSAVSASPPSSADEAMRSPTSLCHLPARNFL